MRSRTEILDSQTLSNYQIVEQIHFKGKELVIDYGLLHSILEVLLDIRDEIGRKQINIENPRMIDLFIDDDIDLLLEKIRQAEANGR